MLGSSFDEGHIENCQSEVFKDYLDGLCSPKQKLKLESLSHCVQFFQTLEGKEPNDQENFQTRNETISKRFKRETPSSSVSLEEASRFLRIAKELLYTEEQTFSEKRTALVDTNSIAYRKTVQFTKDVLYCSRCCIHRQCQTTLLADIFPLFEVLVHYLDGFYHDHLKTSPFSFEYLKFVHFLLEIPLICYEIPGNTTWKTGLFAILKIVLDKSVVVDLRKLEYEKIHGIDILTNLRGRSKSIENFSVAHDENYAYQSLILLYKCVSYNHIYYYTIFLLIIYDYLSQHVHETPLHHQLLNISNQIFNDINEWFTNVSNVPPFFIVASEELLVYCVRNLWQSKTEATFCAVLQLLPHSLKYKIWNMERIRTLFDEAGRDCVISLLLEEIMQELRKPKNFSRFAVLSSSTNSQLIQKEDSFLGFGTLFGHLVGFLIHFKAENRVKTFLDSLEEILFSTRETDWTKQLILEIFLSISTKSIVFRLYLNRIYTKLCEFSPRLLPFAMILMKGHETSLENFNLERYWKFSVYLLRSKETINIACQLFLSIFSTFVIPTEWTRQLMEEIGMIFQFSDYFMLSMKFCKLVQLIIMRLGHGIDTFEKLFSSWLLCSILRSDLVCDELVKFVEIYKNLPFVDPNCQRPFLNVKSLVILYSQHPSPYLLNIIQMGPCTHAEISHVPCQYLLSLPESILEAILQYLVETLDELLLSYKHQLNSPGSLELKIEHDIQSIFCQLCEFNYLMNPKTDSLKMLINDLAFYLDELLVDMTLNMLLVALGKKYKLKEMDVPYHDLTTSPTVNRLRSCLHCISDFTFKEGTEQELMHPLLQARKLNNNTGDLIHQSIDSKFQYAMLLLDKAAYVPFSVLFEKLVAVLSGEMKNYSSIYHCIVSRFQELIPKKVNYSVLRENVIVYGLKHKVIALEELPIDLCHPSSITVPVCLQEFNKLYWSELAPYYFYYLKDKAHDWFPHVPLLDTEYLTCYFDKLVAIAFPFYFQGAANSSKRKFSVEKADYLLYALLRGALGRKKFDMLFVERLPIILSNVLFLVEDVKTENRLGYELLTIEATVDHIASMLGFNSDRPGLFSGITRSSTILFHYVTLVAKEYNFSKDSARMLSKINTLTLFLDMHKKNSDYADIMTFFLLCKLIEWGIEGKSLEEFMNEHPATKFISILATLFPDKQFLALDSRKISWDVQFGKMDDLVLSLVFHWAQESSPTIFVLFREHYRFIDSACENPCLKIFLHSFSTLSTTIKQTDKYVNKELTLSEFYAFYTRLLPSDPNPFFEALAPCFSTDISLIKLAISALCKYRIKKGHYFAIDLVKEPSIEFLDFYIELGLDLAQYYLKELRPNNGIEFFKSLSLEELLCKIPKVREYAEKIYFLTTIYQEILYQRSASDPNSVYNYPFDSFCQSTIHSILPMLIDMDPFIIETLPIELSMDVVHKDYPKKLSEWNLPSILSQPSNQLSKIEELELLNQCLPFIQPQDSLCLSKRRLDLSKMVDRTRFKEELLKFERVLSRPVSLCVSYNEAKVALIDLKVKLEEGQWLFHNLECPELAINSLLPILDTFDWNIKNFVIEENERYEFCDKYLVQLECLAALGQMTNVSKLERPSTIYSKYYQPLEVYLESYLKLKPLRLLKETLVVQNHYYQMARFHDGHYESRISSVELLHWSQLLSEKSKELAELEKRQRSKKNESEDLDKSVIVLRTQLELDRKDYEKILLDAHGYMYRAVENYLFTLKFSAAGSGTPKSNNNTNPMDTNQITSHDSSQSKLAEKELSAVFRLTTIWFNHSELAFLNELIEKNILLEEFPLNVFLPLLCQLSARLESPLIRGFSSVLNNLFEKLLTLYPFHSAYHLLYLSWSGKKGIIEGRKAKAASSLIDKVQKANVKLREILEQMDDLVSSYVELAVKDMRHVSSSNYSLGHSMSTYSLHQAGTRFIKIPILTSAVDSGVTIVGFKDTFQLIGGMNLPKVVQCIGSDGKIYKQLVKYRDDLRQDAVISQLFFLFDSLLVNHQGFNTPRSKSFQCTLPTGFRLRTYRVVPLQPLVGVIEWLTDTKPLGDILLPLHEQYGASNDLSPQQVRTLAKKEFDHPRSTPFSKLEFYTKKIIPNFSPVFRYFFFSRLDDLIEDDVSPDVPGATGHTSIPKLSACSVSHWYHKRLTYSRSLAVSCMIGYIVGLGDRHTQNILIDTKTNEVIQIDLNLIFEQGKYLKIPERVPFRLTPDLIDGLSFGGSIRGAFEKTCRDTLSILRDKKDIILAILQVVRWDPLYKWQKIRSSNNYQKQTGPPELPFIKDMTLAAAQYTLFDSTNSALFHGTMNKSSHNPIVMFPEAIEPTITSHPEAEGALLRVKEKLLGLEEGSLLSVQGQVHYLIQLATSPERLSQMYYGWQPWM